MPGPSPLKPAKGSVMKPSTVVGAQALIEVHLDERIAEIVARTLGPELGESIRTTSCRDGVVMELRAGDLSQLRAEVNSYLRLLGLVVNLLTMLKDQTRKVTNK